MKTKGGIATLEGKLKSRIHKVSAILAMLLGTALLLPGGAAAQTKRPEPRKQGKKILKTEGPNLAKQPTLYVVGYAHLDTEWRWEYPQVIEEYLTKTMRNNFALFQKYPHYIFNFTGANRYMMMKEYYPADFAKLKHYVALGRWFPAGSSMEENDVNSPSPESILRQILYGNEFFRHEFGKASEEYMLPDCFGFPASLPSILAHAGLKGFSTQKLSPEWQPAARVGGPDSPEKTPEGIPFNVGLWEGPDGKTIIAALNPGSYDGDVYTDLSKNNTPPADLGRYAGYYVWDWPDRVNLDGKVTGVYADYHYVGTGDIGGSPNEFSVKLMEAIEDKSMTRLPPLPTFGRGPHPAPQPGPPVRVGNGPLHVIWSDADQMFRDIKPGETSRFPRYKGDLELIHHSAGSITSEAYHKRWNRENETLAYAAEEASVGAAWLGGRPYPQRRLTQAWRLTLSGQFHDLMAGTATPQAYNYTWNDDVIAMNQFSLVLTSATDGIASALDTQVRGTPIVVFNPLNIERQDVVEANFSFPNGAPQGVKVTGPDGQDVPAQLETGTNGKSKVLFLAKVPSVGYAVYDLQASDSPAPESSELKVTDRSLENARYRVTLDKNGDVSSIFDKRLNRELLSAPIRLAILTDNPKQWPAWNMDFDDEQRAPRTIIGVPAKIRVVENGPVRVAIEVSREGEDSKFVQIVRLSAGDAGNRVEFGNVIDWHAKAANLKVVFPFTASNRLATYNWGIGTVERPNEDARQFEVASHRWIDLTDQSGAFGVTVLTDDKYASDKPNDNTLRLTLIRTPGTRGGYTDQGSQDWGHHEFVFGLAAHAGDWRQGQTDWQAYRLNQPLLAFKSSKHAGSLGKDLSLLRVSNSRVRLMALKKAEESNEVIVRLVEISGKPEPNVHITFAAPIMSAREMNGQEQPIGPATVEKGELVTSFSAYQPRTFAVQLTPPRTKVSAPVSRPVALPYDVSVATDDGKPAEGCFDCSLNSQDAPQGKALPAEMLPSEIAYAGIHFHLAPVAAGRPDAVTAHGQTIDLPAGKFNRVYILAASYNPERRGFRNDPFRTQLGDQMGTFRVGDHPVDLTIEHWTGFVGQWDNRTWKKEEVPIHYRSGFTPPPNAPKTRTEEVFAGKIIPGFIKRAPIAWFAEHSHAADGSNIPYAYSYLFAYSLNLPAGTRTLTLPDNNGIRILAVTVANENSKIRPVQPLYDTLERGQDLR